MEYRQFDLGDVELEALVGGVEGGALVVLLHGFPETAESWRGLMEDLAHRGYRVVAPNQRGYGGSSRPASVVAYDLDRLADDIVRLVGRLDCATYTLIGHDWGAAVGWWIASTRPVGLISFCALSAPHPAVWRDAMDHDPVQRRKSRYVRLFGLPIVPEWLIRFGGYRSLEAAMANAQAPPGTLAAYRSAWRAKGALTAMLNWYRALLARRFERPSAFTVEVPTTLVYGTQDPFLSARAADACRKLGTRVRVVPLDNVEHWINHLPSDRLLDLLAPALHPPLCGDRLHPGQTGRRSS